VCGLPGKGFQHFVYLGQINRNCLKFFMVNFERPTTEYLCRKGYFQTFFLVARLVKAFVVDPSL
jgi:hypothetical protein